MKELQEVLESYDVGAQIALVSPTHSEFLYHFPSWSVAQIEVMEEGPALRFNTKRHKFISGRSKHTAVEITVHLIAQFQHLSAMFFNISDTVMKGLSKHMEIENDIGPMYPHNDEGRLAARDPKNRPWRKR
jgi:hypothetical protein